MAKLKAVFDRFDLDKIGKLNGEQVEQLLLYMDRSLETEKTRNWINKLKAGDKEIDFSEFVAEYSVRLLSYLCMHCSSRHLTCNATCLS